jgi:cytochrome c oxidase cbb3-type subunit 2
MRAACSSRSLIVLLLALVAAPSSVAAQAGSGTGNGKVVYDRWCAACHGDKGAGDGESAQYMLPRPRDFTRGSYQIRTTKSGQAPTDADLMHVIDQGMPGTAMPGWRTLLTEQERTDVIGYLKTLAPIFKSPPQPATFSSAPGSSDDALKDGAAVYQKLQCERCHGTRGRGDGPSAPTLKDTKGDLIRAADLTTPWLFNGGSTAEDIYRRMLTGLDGTPMPSYADVIDSKLITDEQLWHVAQYVRSFAPEETPVTQEVIRAYRVPEGLPGNPTDERWNAIEPAYIPLSGQIIIAPRWFAPRIAALSVRAVHNDDSLAVLVSWTDPSRSPDEAWQEWVDGMAALMPDVDGEIPTTQAPDRLHVQFPARPSDGLERPYFLGGDSQRPVYQWRWVSDPDGIQVGTATGLNAFKAGAAEGVTHRAAWADGEWRVQFVRKLASPDTKVAPSFPMGTAIPIAFYASDGSNGESDVRGAVSTWYAIYLDVPTPSSVFVTPVLAALMTAGFGIFVVWRAQRRERQGAGGAGL